MEQLLEYAGWIVAAIAITIAIRANIHFDINEWQRDRRNRKIDNLRIMCPHVTMGFNDYGQPVVNSSFISPPGTTAYECQRCQFRTYDTESIEDMGSYWASHPKELIKREKQVQKLAKKLR